ncbi:uncharacterized protein ARMOST_11688 [Armillaria ostoyae]|uniref:Uncharacterized protein n=1 Tax=Armillaria ostoyae TaxID=47428 RepID=A0A284RHU4_ARMOS|nr:uncharacterized protein ARMOST_11688 [Armillaria ostoyae]
MLLSSPMDPSSPCPRPVLETPTESSENPALNQKYHELDIRDDRPRILLEASRHSGVPQDCASTPETPLGLTRYHSPNQSTSPSLKSSLTVRMMNPTDPIPPPRRSMHDSSLTLNPVQTS